MTPDLLAHGVNLVERALHRFRTGDGAGHPDGEEDRAHPAFLHARDVNVAAGVAVTQVELLVHQTLRRVVVRVDDDRAEVDLSGALGNVFSLRGSHTHH